MMQTNNRKAKVDLHDKYKVGFSKLLEDRRIL